MFCADNESMLSLNKTTLLAITGAIAVTVVAVVAKARHEASKVKPVIDAAVDKVPVKAPADVAAKIWPSAGTTVADMNSFDDVHTVNSDADSDAAPVEDDSTPVDAVEEEVAQDAPVTAPAEEPVAEPVQEASASEAVAHDEDAATASEDTPVKPVRKRAPRKKTAPSTDDTSTPTQEEAHDH